MTVPTIAFFNNKGGVGKTSLVHHVAYMLTQFGYRVVAADLDPQANLSSSLLDESELEHHWEGQPRTTVYGSIDPLLRGIGDIKPTPPHQITDKLWLVVGDLALSSFEDELSSQWPDALDSKERAFRVMTAFSRVVASAADTAQAHVALIDVGPNLGAINRSALVAADRVVVPLGPDMFSLQGLRNLGPMLTDWRRGWAERVARKPKMDLVLPTGRMEPMGYVVMQHGIRLGRPVKAYQQWIDRIPATYHEAVLDQQIDGGVNVHSDAECLALLKHYASLVPMAQEARKPMFLLRPADGAIGAHQAAVQRAYSDFSALSHSIVNRMRESGTPIATPENLQPLA